MMRRYVSPRSPVVWRNERDKPTVQQTPGWLANFAVKADNTLDALERSSPEAAATCFGLAHASLARVGAHASVHEAAAPCEAM